MLSPPFTAILKSGREEFNAQFAVAKKQFPALDPEVFASFLKDTVDPLVTSMHSTNPEATVGVTQAAYEVGLELVGQRLMGAQARHPWVQQLWSEVLPSARRLLPAEPRKMLGALSNAAHQLGTVPGARPQEWLAILNKLLPLTDSPALFLNAGQVAAWRCGLAHYRESALTVADLLPPELAMTALMMPSPTAEDGASWPTLREHMHADRWHLIRGKGQTSRTFRPVLALRTGAFRGFGGLFPEPPRVVVGHGQIFVRSGEEGWLLTADAFGATFHRATTEELAAASPQIPSLPEGVEVPGDIGAVTSVARLEHTMAVTGTLTHAVLLYALPVKQDAAA